MKTAKKEVRKILDRFLTTLLSKISNTTSMFAKRLNGDYKTLMMAECSAKSRSRNGCPDGSGSKMDCLSLE